MTLLQPNAGAGPSGLPPMTLEQAADYANRLALIEGRFLEIVHNDPVTWAANSAKAAIVLFGHARDVEVEYDRLQTVLAVGGAMLRMLLDDPDIGPRAHQLCDALYPEPSEEQP